MNPSIWVVIPSAGKGTRFGSPTPKQYQKIFEKTVLEHTVSRFVSRPDVCGVIVAVSMKDFALHIFPEMEKITIVAGGEDRASSVYSALLYLQNYASSNDLVAVHDAARPCLRQSAIDKLFISALQQVDGAILASPIADTIKWVDAGVIQKTLDREHVFLAQTPQVFRYGLLIDALEYAKSNSIHVTDEASAVELLGFKPVIVKSEKENIKITTADDLDLAAFWLEKILKEND